MANHKVYPSQHSNAYNLFIIVLTIFALILMVLLLLPLDKDTLHLLHFYDILICLIFLIDFLVNLITSPRKSAYLVGERGWLDLIGSIPSLGLVFRFSGILRLARISRVDLILRAQRGRSRIDLVKDVLQHRHRYVGYTAILLTIVILTTASALVLQFESRAPEAKITTGWQAFWFSIVTITTVGYGDYYPVTFLGQLTAMFIMLSGIGVIAVLASLLSRMLIGAASELHEEIEPNPGASSQVEQEVASIKVELAELRRMLERMSEDNSND
jgi:voltage-gated potassium channel